MYFFKKGDQNTLIKFIGGFLVVLIAVKANDSYVYFLAVIIAGLIIASERFMSVLIALLKGSSDIWKYDNFIKMIEKMSPEEVDDKTQIEIQEIREESQMEAPGRKVLKDGAVKLNTKQIEEYEKRIPEIERKALSKYEKLTGFKIKKNIKLGKLMLDGVGINKISNKIYFFEVKMIPDLNKKTIDDSLADRIIQRLKVFIPNMLLALDQEIVHKTYPGYKHFTFTIIIVVDSDRNLDKIMEKVSTLKLAYNHSQQNITVKFVFYNSSKL